MIKKFITLFFLFIATHKLYSQDLPPKGEYVKNPDLAKLAGTWQGVNGNDTFTLVLKFRPRLPVGPWFADALLGWHSYAESSTIESSNLSMLNNEKESSAMFFSLNAVDINKGLTIQFHDLNRSNGSVEVSFKLLPGKANEALWRITGLHEGTHTLLLPGEKPPVRPPVSKLTAIPEWHMKKIK